MAKRPSYVNRKKDKNHGEIVTALKQAGVAVMDTSALGGGYPDALVKARDGRYVFLEIKMPKGTLSPAQEAIRKTWNVAVVRSVDDALKAVGVR
jgi:Holliday junction resolvase